jgi:elongation factor G
VIAGFPVQDVRVVVYDGKAHSVDSKEIAFATAGRKAFCDAVTKASPIVLEPIVKLQINAPEYALGDITGDLSSNAGRSTAPAARPRRAAASPSTARCRFRSSMPTRPASTA